MIFSTSCRQRLTELGLFILRLRLSGGPIVRGGGSHDLGPGFPGGFGVPGAGMGTGGDGGLAGGFGVLGPGMGAGGLSGGEGGMGRGFGVLGDGFGGLGRTSFSVLGAPALVALAALALASAVSASARAWEGSASGHRGGGRRRHRRRRRRHGGGGDDGGGRGGSICSHIP
uniref:Uncharacterized protein n=1 Tax=Setaria italica TaxID=4555 RepID=K3XPB0_SETIT